MTEKIPGGYIVLARKILRSEIMEKPPLFLKLFVWMLLQASHKDHGNLKRGQFFTSLEKMRKAMAYKVGYRTVRPTVKEIRGITKFLTKTHMLVTTKVSRGLLITILNYDLYQDWKNYEGHDEGHNEGPSGGTPYNKEGNTKKGNKPVLDFSSEISLLKHRYPEPQIIDQALDAIRSTRKAGKVSESVTVSILQSWEKYPVDSVLAGIRAWLSKGFAPTDSKAKEKYLLGIIRNQRDQENRGQDQGASFKSTGSALLDDALRNPEKYRPVVQ